MKKLPSISRLTLVTSVGLIFFLGALRVANGAEFFCPSGNVTCLIAAINEANGLPGKHTINLEPGIYTLQTVDNITDGPNGLPSIRRAIRIQSSVDDASTIIERDPSAQLFRVFHISLGGEFNLDGVTVQEGFTGFGTGPAIFNRGITTLRDSVVTNSRGEAGAIRNLGTLNIFRSIISDNSLGHQGGGIRNEGNALVQNSTIAHNISADGGGIFNIGSLVLRNSAIIFNSTDCCQPGGGIFNLGGSVEIVNSTIAKNVAGGSFGIGGGGVGNFNGQVSISNSTVRENRTLDGNGGGISTSGGTVQIQNTIVAGNTLNPLQPFRTGPECSGTITSLGNNLVGEPSGCSIDLQPSDLTGDPSLASLVGTEYRISKWHSCSDRYPT